MRVLTPLGEQMRDALPPVLRESPDYLGLIHALATECERAEAAVEMLRQQLKPSTATLLLPVWERLVRVEVDPAGWSDTERQGAVTARLRSALSLSRGSSWEQQITDLVGVGWDYREHDPADESSPPAGTLLIRLPTVRLEGREAIREITPAHLDLTFEAVGGFELDASALDVEVLSI